MQNQLNIGCIVAFKEGKFHCYNKVGNRLYFKKLTKKSDMNVTIDLNLECLILRIKNRKAKLLLGSPLIF